VYSNIKEHTWRGLVAGVAGAALGFGVAVSPVIPTAPSLPWIALLGFVAISAMLLPGISGSYILLILGQYEYMLEQIHERNLLVVGTFAVGAVLGLLIFAKLLAYVLKHWHAVTFSALLGIMVGALYGPAKVVAEDPSWLALTLAFAGAGIVLLIEWQARRS
jgi:putative membrane protein